MYVFFIDMDDCLNGVQLYVNVYTTIHCIVKFCYVAFVSVFRFINVLKICQFSYPVFVDFGSLYLNFCCLDIRNYRWLASFHHYRIENIIFLCFYV